MKVSDLFIIERGSGKYTRAYAQAHQGEYPLYSGNTTSVFAGIDSYDYSAPCLSWAIDGLAGYMMIHCDPFSATNHRGILLPKIDDIDIRYAKHILEPIFREIKKGRLGDNGENEYTSLPPFMIKDLEFEVPVDETGAISLSLQQEIAEQFTAVGQHKSQIIEKLQTLISQRITFKL